MHNLKTRKQSIWKTSSDFNAELQYRIYHETSFWTKPRSWQLHKSKNAAESIWFLSSEPQKRQKTSPFKSQKRLLTYLYPTKRKTEVQIQNTGKEAFVLLRREIENKTYLAFVDTLRLLVDNFAKNCSKVEGFSGPCRCTSWV